MSKATKKTANGYDAQFMAKQAKPAALPIGPESSRTKDVPAKAASPSKPFKRLKAQAEALVEIGAKRAAQQSKVLGIKREGPWFNVPLRETKRFIGSMKPISCWPAWMVRNLGVRMQK